MGAIKIRDGIYSVGVLNPNMRIFDVVMKTEYGTSYNAYLVKGKKTALIETVHPRFFEEYLENIRSVTDPAQIDYIIMNHNEPDHSGSLARLLNMAPNAQVLSSRAGAIYIKAITNKTDVRVKAVADGETLDLGAGRVLQFINAPFLHWPDTMFTWLAKDSIAFTCDFLGTHFCEPRMIDSHIAYPQKYEAAFQNYFDSIMAPFKPYVLQGLEKLEKLGAQTVCVSHGPILTSGVRLELNKKLYKQWATPAARTCRQIPLFYCSAYGNTAALAERIAKGIRGVLPDARVETFDINESPLSELSAKMNEADAFLLGSTTINRDAVRPVWELAATIDAINSKGKHASAFGSFGWSGEAVPMLMQRLQSLKLKPFENGFTCRFVPSETELADAEAFGARFAQAL